MSKLFKLWTILVDHIWTLYCWVELFVDAKLKMIIISIIHFSYLSCQNWIFIAAPRPWKQLALRNILKSFFFEMADYIWQLDIDARLNLTSIWSSRFAIEIVQPFTISRNVSHWGGSFCLMTFMLDLPTLKVDNFLWTHQGTLHNQTLILRVFLKANSESNQIHIL